MRPARILPALIPIAALALAGIAGSPARAEAPRVVATVAPIHSLVASVMHGVGQPDLLIEGAASPHGYSLVPSEVAALEEAELVFWVGPALEQFLEDRLPTLADDAEIVALMDAEGVRLLTARDENIWTAETEDYGHDDGEGEHDDERHGGEDHLDEDHADDHHAHDHGAFDSHVWLDPMNAVAMAGAIADALARVDPANAGRYSENAEMLAEELRAMDADLAARLADVDEVPFVVFHDAYAYLETRYDLTALGAIALSPELQPGARTVAEIQQAIADNAVVCVFAEPQFPPRLVETVIAGSQVRTAVLDPLGIDLPPGPGLYRMMMINLADGLTGCLHAR